MNSGRNSLLIVGAILLAVYLWMQSQSKTRGLATTKLPVKPANSPNALAKLLSGLMPKSSGSPKGGGGSGAGTGSGGGSGSATAAGQKACNQPPCGGNVFVGTDSSGNDIYQRPDGSFVYSDGSAATQCDIATNACGLAPSSGFVGPVQCTQPQCQPQCVQTAQPCCSAGACGGCSGSGCFCGGCVC